MSVNRVQLLSLLSVKRVCFGKLQTSLCINFYIEAHPPGRKASTCRASALGSLGTHSFTGCLVSRVIEGYRALAVAQCLCEELFLI